MASLILTKSFFDWKCMWNNKVFQIDFVLFEEQWTGFGNWKPVKTLVFKFLPAYSSCHSFNEDPPTRWNEVYKVYYSYEVGYCFDGEYDTLFSCMFDECSIIRDVAKYLIKNSPIVGKVKETFVPFGDGVIWEISTDEDSDIVKFVMWNKNNTGYRFGLHQEKAHQFGVFLNDCCEYMLAHGEPI